VPDNKPKDQRKEDTRKGERMTLASGNEQNKLVTERSGPCVLLPICALAFFAFFFAFLLFQDSTGGYLFHPQWS
jgi:hypothetical protein